MSELNPLTAYLCEAIDTTAANIESISQKIEHACEILTNALLNDKKIIICGNGLSHSIGNILSTSLLTQQEFARPGLPAINLSIDSTSILTVSKNNSQHQVFAHQINAIANENDILITFSVDGNCSNIIQAIQAAHEKHVHVVSICGFGKGKVSAVLQSEDISIDIDSSSVARVLEIQLLISNSLCHQLEATLFDGMA
ncbi:MAG: SIS domain-containing protein [Oleiphilus sp.]